MAYELLPSAVEAAKKVRLLGLSVSNLGKEQIVAVHGVQLELEL